MGRKLKHKDDLTENKLESGRGMDHCHKTMREIGFCRFLFWRFARMRFLNPTTTTRRLLEYKTFVLQEPSMNTVDQMSSVKEVKMIS